MAYVSFKKTQSLDEALTETGGVIQFPTNSPSIVMGGKEYGWPRGCYTVSTLTGIPISYPCVFASLSADDTVDFISAPVDGRTYRVMVFNSSTTASISISVSTSSNIGASVILMKGSVFSSGDGKTTTSLSLSVQAQCGIVLSFTRFGSVMLLEA